MKWKKKYYTPLFYILPTHSRGWIWRNFNESAQVTRYRSINQLIWFFLYISQSQGKKVKKKKLPSPHILLSGTCIKVKILQLLARPSMDLRFTMRRWLHWEYYLNPIQPTNQNTGMENYPDPAADFIYCRFSFSVKL